LADCSSPNKYFRYGAFFFSVYALEEAITEESDQEFDFDDDHDNFDDNVNINLFSDLELLYM
jgi:hypothetical protein